MKSSNAMKKLRDLQKLTSLRKSNRVISVSKFRIIRQLIADFLHLRKIDNDLDKRERLCQQSSYLFIWMNEKSTFIVCYDGLTDF